jgi:hypothetical protein
LHRDASLNPSQVQIEETHLQGDRAMAQVTVRCPTAEGGVLVYHETHFYRQRGRLAALTHAVLALMDSLGVQNVVAQFRVLTAQPHAALNLLLAPL